MNIKDHFLGLNREFGNIIFSSCDSEHGPKLNELFQFIDDLALWLSILENKIDTTILINAIKEYEFGFQAAVCGQYRYSFLSQRYFMEQITRFIYLSTNELYLRQWKLGQRDVSWATIIDKEDGIFSKIFIRAFYSDVESEGEQFINIVSKLYRESSEFIHGNYCKINTIPSQITFDNNLLKKWLEYMETEKFVTLFLLFMRFSKDLDKETISKLEVMAQDEISNIEGFQQIFL